MNQRTHNVADVLADLDAGLFLQKVSRQLQDTALGVAEHGRKGKIVLTLELERIGESHQLKVKHTAKYTRPTKRGTVVEDDTTETPMYVGRGGRLTLFPETQGALDFETQGAPARTE